jgi:HK97 family phage major capsid protein
MDEDEIAELIREHSEKLEGIATEQKAKIDTLETKLADETKEREALEMRLQRLGIGAGGGDPAQVDPTEEFKGLSNLARSARNPGGLAAAADELIAMSVGTDADGGYLVLPALSSRMNVRLRDKSPMRQLARIEIANKGDKWEEPDDRDEAGAEWVGEKQTRSETDTPELGKYSIDLNELSAKPKVTQRLLDDADYDIGGWLEGKVSDKFARTEGAAFINGDGILKPRGLLTYDAVTDGDFTRTAGKVQYVKTGHASAFPASNPADVLRTLMWSLRTPYRQGAAWLMNSNTASTIDKFKNGQGDYIWRDGMTAGAPPSLLGYPVYLDEEFPDLGANAFPIAFGNFQQAYVIVDRPGLKFLPDPYTDKPNVLFYSYKRVGGGLANDDAVKLLKCEA